VRSQIPADESEQVQKIPKLVQRIRSGSNLPGPTRPLSGARIATLDPPRSFLTSPR
jgi:hypothetical protein